MKSIRKFVVDKLSEETSFPANRFLSLFKTPDSIERGDLALPCFPFAKELKKKPDEIAKMWVEKFSGDEIFLKVEATGPFLNFTYNGVKLAEQLLPQVLENSDNFGNSESGKGKTVAIDFSSPNIAKPIAFHHIRSTVLGNSLSKLHAACGWQVERINYFGDWGTQFGKLIVAYKLWGSQEKLEESKIRHLLDIYVKFHEEVETNPKLDDEARNWFLKMEQGNEEALELWQLFYDISLQEFNKIYGMLGVKFDHFEGESKYRDQLDSVIKLVDERAGTVISKGALVVEMDDDKLPPCLLKKADGATLYATRDIAAAIDRYERFKYDRSLYVVAQQQAVHFKQLFSVLKKMGYDWAENLSHISFGMVQLKDQTMSTRKGTVIFLEDVLKRSINLSMQAIENKNAELSNKEEVAAQVGIGAIIFGDLINRRTNDITFEWERILNFQGETGVYVQYTHARCCSMLRKASSIQGGLDWSLLDYNKLDKKEEKHVLKLVGQLKDKIEKSCNDFDPSILAKHLIDLCKAFNRVYNIEDYRFLADDEVLRTSRLALCKACIVALKKGLNLLGIEAPEEM